MPTHRTKFEIDADTRKMESKLKGTESKIKGIGSRIKNFFSIEVIAGITAAILAIRRLMSVASEWIGLSNEQEKVEKKLAAALKNSNAYSTEYFNSLKKYASQLQQVTGIGDETTLSVMAMLTAMGLQGKALLKATELSADLAHVMDVDVKSAAKVMADAFAGQTGMLGRYIKGLDKTKPLLEQIEKAVGGQAKAFGETGAGALQKYAAAVGDVKEKLGDFVKIALKPAAETATAWLEEVQEYMATPVSQKIANEQMELNALVGALINAGDNQDKRNRYIAQLQQNYPDFIKNINLEKASSAELAEQLKKTNQEYVKKIELQIKQEELESVIRKRVKLQKEEADLLEKINKFYINTMGQNADVTLSVEQKITAMNTQLGLSKDRFMPGFGMQLTQIADLQYEYNRSIEATNTALEEENKILADVGSSIDIDVTPKVIKAQAALKQINVEIMELQNTFKNLEKGIESGGALADLSDDFDRVAKKIYDITYLAENMGAALGGAIEHKDLKESLKQILMTILSFIEKEYIAGVAAAMLRGVIGDVTGFAQIAAAAAIIEALKAGIASFATGVEGFMGGLARVHKDEVTYLPKGSSVYNKREAAAMFDTSRIEGLLQTLISVTASNQAGRKTLDIYTLTNMIEKEKSKRL